MKGKQGRKLRRISAVIRLEHQITQYEETVKVEKDSLKVLRKEKSTLVKDVENRVNKFGEKLDRAKTALLNTKHNLRNQRR